MNIRDFVYEDGYFIYEEGNERYDIKLEEFDDGFDLTITSNQKGRRAKNKTKEITNFLQQQFYHHPEFRWEYLMKDKKDLYMNTHIKKSEIQYYYVEMIQLLFAFCVLIMSVCFDKNLTFYIYIPLQFSLSFYSIKFRTNIECGGFLEESIVLHREFENRDRRVRNKKCIFIVLFLLALFL